LSREAAIAPRTRLPLLERCNGELRYSTSVRGRSTETGCEGCEGLREVEKCEKCELEPRNEKAGHLQFRCRPFFPTIDDGRSTMRLSQVHQPRNPLLGRR